MQKNMLKLLMNLFKQKDTDKLSSHIKQHMEKNYPKQNLFIISDLDGTLVEGKNTDGLKEFKKWITDNKNKVVFGVASGRNKEITQQAFKEYDLPNA